MRIKFKLEYLIGVSLGILLVIFDFVVFLESRWFVSVLIIAVAVMTMQFWKDFFKENKRQKQVELSFLEMVRHLVESVRSGIAIPQAILHVADKDYGPLSPHVRKLASQIRLGIPIHIALRTFANDTENAVIKRSISIVIEAEESGGDIDQVLESVTRSVVQVKNIRAEQKATSFSHIIQGYIVFFVFIGIMLIMQLKLFPTLLNLGGGGSGISIPGLGTSGGGESAVLNLDRIFIALIVVQGFFAGLMIGKLSEGKFMYGIKHSLALVGVGLLVITTFKGGF